MESYIDIQYITNLINLGYPSKYSITQLEIIKTKIILLLSTNDLIVIDSKKVERISQRHFCNKIQSIKVHKDNLFIIQETKLCLVNQNTCEDQVIFDFGEKVYTVAFCEEKTSIIYVNDQHHIKYYSKGLIEAKKIVLSKENIPIDRIIYQAGILLWATRELVKVFQLKTKQMLFKKVFKGNIARMDCLLFNSILCMNINRKEVFVVQLPTEDNHLIQARDLLHIKTESKSEYVVGMWINSSLNKLSVLFHDNNVILKIYKINQVITGDGNEIIYNKSFDNITSLSTFHFYFSMQSSYLYLYNSNEIFFVTFLEKTQKMFNDLQDNSKTTQLTSAMTLDIIYDSFDSFSLNEKQYLLCKMIRIRKSISQFDEKKYFILVNSFYDSSTSNRIAHGVMVKLFSYFIMTLLRLGELEYCYSAIKEKFNDYLNTTVKEEILKYLLRSDSFSLLITFINELKSFDITGRIEKLFKSEENNEKALYANAQIQKKNMRYNEAIKLLISIKRRDEIFQILSEGNQELFFEFDELFDLLDELHLLNILDSIYFKDATKCQLFFDKFFTLCSKEKISRVSLALIAHDKFKFIQSTKTAEILFNVILLNSDAHSNYVLFLLKYIKMYEDFDYNKLIKDNEVSLLEAKHTDLLIALLTYTKNYKEIINIFIDQLKDPDKCIQYIENNNIEDVTKEEIYAYLTTKIKDSKTLSITKKFYFIFQFQDNITFKENGTDLNLIDELNTSDEDDFNFLLLIIEQLKLKVKILEISGGISKNTIKQMMHQYKKELQSGKVIDFKKIFICCCDSCENRQFNKEDTVICFRHCLHVYHKDCLYDQRENCPSCDKIT